MKHSVENCLIIAAGRGSRLAGLARSKPLHKVGGRSLIEWVISSVAVAGPRRFVVVTGYRGDEVAAFLSGLASRTGLTIGTVFNEDWEKENGLSVLKGGGAIEGQFILSMTDHLFEPGLVSRLLAVDPGPNGAALAVDRRVGCNPNVDEDDVTRVATRDGRITGIGKHLTGYDAYDTGVFRAGAGLFQALAESRDAGDCSLSGGMRVLAGRGLALAVDAGGAFWLDVDDEKALAKAEKAADRELAGIPSPARAGNRPASGNV